MSTKDEATRYATRYNSKETSVLSNLRRATGLTQDRAGAYFGLKGNRRRESVGKWERGQDRPSIEQRPRFVTYLWNELKLSDKPERFLAVWNSVMVGEWKWLPLVEGELPPDFPDDQGYRSKEAPPFQAIPPPQHFVVRTRILDALREALLAEEHNGLYSLVGSAGTGKTTLAAYMAVELKDHFGDGVLWGQLNAQDTMSILSVFAEACGRDVSQYHDIPTRSQIVRELLAHRRTLVILDDARSSEQILPLLVPHGPCAVLITTRRHDLAVTRTAHKYEIGPFDERQGEASELFFKVLGESHDESELALRRQLAELLGFLPLALDIAVSRIANEPHWTLSTFLDQLRPAKERLDELRFEDLSVRVAYDVSYEALDAGLRQLFASLGVFGGEDFGIDAVAFVAETSHKEAHRELRKLYGYSLVQQGLQERYRLHPLLRDFAREKLTDFNAARRMAEYYVSVLQGANALYQQGGVELRRGLELFDLESGNIKGGQAWAQSSLGEYHQAVELCNDYGTSGGFLLHLRLHPQKRIRWWGTALIAAQRLKARSAEAQHLKNLGTARLDLGEFDAAAQLLEQALAIYRELEDAPNECSVLDKLGLTQTRLSDYRHAIEYHEQALRLARVLGDQHKEGNALGNLGVAYKNLRDFGRAIKYQEQALRLAQAIGDRYGEGASLNDIGNAYLESGQVEHAVHHYNQALIVNREVGNRQVEADVLSNLGEAYVASGQYARAIEFYAEAVKIDEEVSNPYGQAHTLNNLGAVNLKLDDPERTIEHSDQALAIARKYGYPLLEADALLHKGQALAKSRLHDEAALIAQAALEIYERHGTRTATIARELLTTVASEEAR